MRRLSQVTVAASLAAVVSAVAAACGGSNSNSSLTAPSGTLTNSVFNGTVNPSATTVFTFTVTSPGPVSVTLTSAGPPPTITMGLGIGNPDGSGNCIFLQGGTTQAVASTTTAQLSGNLTASGAYCVAVGDIGNAAGPITFTVVVSHT
jgi:hypothetical protein